MERVLVLIGYFSGERMCIRHDNLRQNSMIKGNMIGEHDTCSCNDWFLLRIVSTSCLSFVTKSDSGEKAEGALPLLLLLLSFCCCCCMSCSN